MSYCDHGFGRCPACDEPTSLRNEVSRRAIAAVLDVQRILAKAFGPDLGGCAPESSAYYLALIRDRLRGVDPAAPAQACADCLDLRARLVNVYHLTLTGDDAAAVVLAVRAASGPGAPSPAPAAPRGLPRCGDCGMVTPPGALRQLHHVGCGAGAPGGRDA